MSTAPGRPAAPSQDASPTVAQGRDGGRVRQVPKPDPVAFLESIDVDIAGTPVLRELDLRLEAGEVIGLLGPNGSGKTTLLRVLAGLLAPVGGQGQVLGADLRAGGAAGRAARAGIRTSVVLVGHQPALYPQLGLGENLRLVARLTGRAEADAASALETVGLAAAAHRRADHCSHGMLRRADLARAFLTEPRLLLLDEAHAGLDRDSLHLVQVLTERVRARSGACVLVSHERDRMRPLADRIVELVDGAAVPRPVAAR